MNWPGEATLSWVDVAAVLIALAAWFVAVYEARQTRRHNRLSVRPWLTFTRSVAPMDAAHPIPGIYLLNNGIGPATITRLTLTVGERQLEGDAYEQWQQAVDASGLRQFDVTCNAIEVPSGLGAGEQRGLLQVPAPDAQEHHVAWQRGLCSIGCFVEYESFYGEHFTTELQPISVEQLSAPCTAPTTGAG